MAERTRILGIVPYEGLKTTMEKVAKQRDDVTLDVYVGDMQEGVAIAKFHEQDGYDVIISRGAVMRMIKRAVKIPVVSVDFSAYDILRAMKLAENYPYQYAIVGFPTITKPARLLCDLLQKNIDIVTVYREEDTINAVRDLKNRGFSMVIGGTLGVNYAKKTGLAGIFITSGEESVEDAFDQAVEMSRGYSEMKEHRLLYENILKKEQESTLIFDSQQNLYFSTWDAQRYGRIESFLRAEIGLMPEEGYKKLQVFKDTLFSIRASRIDIWGRSYTLFRLRQEDAPAARDRCGLFFSNKKEAETYFYNSFFGASGAMGKLEEKINSLIKSPLPIMLAGEKGTGKDQIARYIYINSLLSHNPLTIVDCELINDKSWTYLMNGAGSPFAEANQTVFIRTLDALSEQKCRQLRSMILERNLHKRSRLIFSCIPEKNGAVSERAILFTNLFSCMSLHLLPLKDRKEELPVLANLYIGKTNLELAKQIIGFEPGGIELLQGFAWPYNYTQLKRVLDKLASVTETPYISCYHIRELLDTEEGGFETPAAKPFDFDRTLEEITRDIIKRQLEQSNGNQSAAAKKLGISRTTLWRYLKQG